MVGLTGSAEAVIDATADAVFALLTTPSRLPAWNATMVGIEEDPGVVSVGSEWVVNFQVAGAMRWRSRSRCEELNAVLRTFEHRSATDDGNSSFSLWRWTVTPETGGARVRVGWDLHPATFWRRSLLGPMRNRMLRREVPASLAALAAVASRG